MTEGKPCTEISRNHIFFHLATSSKTGKARHRHMLKPAPFHLAISSRGRKTRHRESHVNTYVKTNLLLPDARLLFPDSRCFFLTHAYTLVPESCFPFFPTYTAFSRLTLLFPDSCLVFPAHASTLHTPLSALHFPRSAPLFMAPT